MKRKYKGDTYSSNLLLVQRLGFGCLKRLLGNLKMATQQSNINADGIFINPHWLSEP